MSLPGSAHIPRNCEHSTMDRGNLNANQNLCQQWCSFTISSDFQISTAADTYQEMWKGVNCSSPTSSSSDESNSLVLMTSKWQKQISELQSVLTWFTHWRHSKLFRNSDLYFIFKQGPTNKMKEPTLKKNHDLTNFLDFINALQFGW